MAAVTESFHVGKKFTSFQELQNCKEMYETSNSIHLAMRDSKTLEHRLAPIRAARANKELRYYLLRLCCTYGGKKFKKRGHGTRETKSRKVGCGMFIRLALSDDGQSLDVVEMNENHSSHAMSAEEVSLRRSQQSRLDPAHLELAETLISIRANSKPVQHHLRSTSGKVTLVKDIANIGSKLKQQSMPNNLTEVLKQLQSHGDCVVAVLASVENIFRGIFYQDQYMQEVFKSYPEVLFCDATCKLLDLRLAVYMMLAVDSSGQSEIVAVMLLANETRSTMSAAIKIFQQHNPHWTKTVSITTDKDFVEREVFTDLFPNAVLLISVYHTLCTFQREVTCEKMGITSSQCEQCLSVLQDLAYSANEDAYNRNMERLLALECEKVNEYVKESWEPIRHEWVEGLKAEHLTFGESTNNPLESIDAKIKSVCLQQACLQRFFVDFRSSISSMRIERRQRALMDFSKKPTTPVPAEMVPYLGFLTPFAFDFVMAQYDKSLHAEFTARSEDNFIFKSDDDTVSTTPENCGCIAYCTKRLPCQHMLYVRRWLGLSFDETVMDSRWTRLTYMTQCNSIQTEAALTTESIGHVDESGPVQGISQLSQADKYRKSLNLTDSIASLCCEREIGIFERRCRVLQQLCDLWSKGVEVLGFLTHNVPAAPAIGRAMVVKEAKVETHELAGVHKMDLVPATQMPRAAMRKRILPKGSETTVIDAAKKRQRKA